MHAQVECVKRGMFVRGGLTIGRAHVGLDGRGSILGDAMVRAYEIEQGEAVHPRVIIDDAAISAFMTDSSLWQHAQFDEGDVEMALGFIAVAEDGSHFVDYRRAADAGEFDDGEVGRFAFLARHRDVIEGEVRSCRWATG